MKAFLFTRNLHSSVVDEHRSRGLYDLYFYDQEILNPRTLLDFHRYGTHRRNLVTRVIGDLSLYLGKAIEPLSLRDLPTWFENSGVKELHVTPELGVEMGGLDPRVIIRNPRTCGLTKSKIFKRFYDSVKDLRFETVEPILELELQALKLLRNYLNSMEGYAKDRSSLSRKGGMSLLSPYISLGVLKLQTLYHQIDLVGPGSEDLVEFKRQCLWALYTRYRYNQFNSWDAKPLSLPEKQSLTGWIEGTLDQKTGVERFINRYMRSLREGVRVSNRFRLITSYYLHFKLGVPWIYGQSYFRQVLVDYHPASNFINWYLQCVRNRYTRFYNLDKQIAGYDHASTA